MSTSFWVSLVIWLLSGLQLLCDHRETRQELRAAMRRAEIRWIRFKLLVLWSLFTGAFIGVVVTGAEAIADKEERQAASEQFNVVSNRMYETGRKVEIYSNAWAKAERAAAVAQQAEQNTVEHAKRIEQAAKPRRIVEQQKTIMLSLIRPAEGETIDVIYSIADTEAAQFAADLIAILKEAGYSVEDTSAVHVVMGGGAPDTGLSVTVNASPTPRSLNSLHQAFTAAGIEANWFGVDMPSPNKIHVFVGRRH